MTTVVWLWIFIVAYATFLCVISAGYFDAYTCRPDPDAFKSAALKVGVCWLIKVGAGVARLAAAKLSAVGAGLSKSAVSSTAEGGSARAPPKPSAARFWLFCGILCLIVDVAALREFELGLAASGVTYGSFGACWYAAVLFVAFCLVGLLVFLLFATALAVCATGLKHHEAENSALLRQVG